jgi:CRP-like cAMP-binding protein/Fe-S-cluster-containing hydrogenase component 2
MPNSRRQGKVMVQAAAQVGEEPVDKPKISLGPATEPVDIARLREYPFFAKVSETVLGKWQKGLREQRFQPGDTILRAGSYTDAAHYIASGIVSVHLSPIDPSPAAAPSRPAPAPMSLVDRVREIFNRAPARQAVQQGGVKPDQTIMLADLPIDLRAREEVFLEAGEVFGEMSALSRYPVSADVIARTEVLCLLIPSSVLALMFKQKDKSLADFKQMIDSRYRERALSSHLRSVGLFSGLGDPAIEELRKRADLLSFEPGALIVEQGTPADRFYLVRGGYVRVAMQVGASNAAVSYLRRGDYAGEIGLLLDEPWPFSLSALEHVEIVSLSRELFREVLDQNPAMQKELWELTVKRLKERGAVAREPLLSRYLQMAMDTGLIHGESVLLIDLNTCTRCDDCVRGCADTHGGVPRFVREGSKFRSWSVPTACYQCTDPVCMIGCPTGAITRPLGTLEVTINKDTCIGCGICVGKYKDGKLVSGCPWHNIVPVPFSSPTLKRDIDLATKCDLCLGRPQGPACVQMCPHGSAVRISFKDLETVTSTLSSDSI